MNPALFIKTNVSIENRTLKLQQSFTSGKLFRVFINHFPHNIVCKNKRFSIAKAIEQNTKFSGNKTAHTFFHKFSFSHVP